MTPHFEKVQSLLKRLPGLGYRSAERIALHLLVEKREDLDPLVQALQDASKNVHACSRCGHIAEGELCEICGDSRRDASQLCIVEHVPDLVAMERSGAYRGRYHVLQGKLSPIHGVGPENLNLSSLKQRIQEEEVTEIILAVSNDIEGEATCHFLQEEIFPGLGLKITRIGFGLPSGGGIPYADATTLRSALEGRRNYH